MMKTKKQILALCCASLMLLSGCSTSSNLFISYDDINILKSEDVQDVIPASTVDPFTKNIAVISGNGSIGGTNLTSSSVAADISAVEEATDANSTSTDDSVTGTVSSTDDTSVTDDTALTDTPALLVNRTTNEILYYNDAFTEIAPASLTKLMTALLALKYGIMTDEVQLTSAMNANMVSEAQTCGFVAGDVVSLETLFKCMLVYSGNETANAIAIHIAGSIQDFVDMMNEEAVKLGAVNTHFVNTNGLDVENHYSSVYDLYLIFNECMKYDLFVSAMTTSSLTISYTSSTGAARGNLFQTTNYYLKGDATSPDGLTVYGGKTGTTTNAGACLICYLLDDAGDEYIAVSMGNSSKDELYSQMNKILSKIQN